MPNLVEEREVVVIVALHLEGEANVWWFSDLKHARLIAYGDFTQRLIKKFDKRKPEVVSIETFPEIDEK